MNILVYAAIAAAAVAPASLSAESNRTITVTSSPTVEQWSHRVGGSLNRNMENILARPFQESRVPDGLVAVRFKCSEAGRPSAIEFSQRSGSAALDSLAREAVSGLRNMHPLPSGIREDQVYEAVISVASNGDQFGRQIQKYRDAMAAQSRNPKVLAIVITANSGRPS